MSVGSRIREARKKMGLSQGELAVLAGITQSAIGNYETNVSNPKEPIMLKLMDILQVDANYLYQDEMRAHSRSRKMLDEAWGKTILEAYISTSIGIQQSVCKLLDLDHIQPPTDNK